MAALKKDLGLIAAASIVTGCVIGSGVFVKPGKVLAATGNSSLALVAWLLGGLITIAGGLTMAEISTRIPKTGGVYIYIEEMYGKRLGFLCGWVLTFVYGPALQSALALYFASLFCSFFKLNVSLQIPVAMAAAFSLASLSVFGTKYAGMLQTLSTFAKLIPIFAIGLVGVWMGHEKVLGVSALAPGSTGTGLGMGAAILATLWAYDGWVQVGTMAGEMKNPGRDLPRAIIVGLLVVLVAYILVNVSILSVLPASEVAALNDKAAVAVSEKLFGPFGATLIHLGILISIFGCLNGNTLATTRVPFAMGVRGDLPSWVARTQPRFGTPQNAIILQTTVAFVMILSGQPDLITDIGIAATYVFYAMAFVGILKLRRKKVGEKLSSYRVPLYPVIPIVATAGCAYIIVSTVQNQPKYVLAALLVTLAGLPFQYWMGRRVAIGS